MAIHPLLANSVDFELRFCIEVLKLGSLHLGYSDSEDESITNLDDVRIAQARYTQHIVDSIPADVSTILDVGCGIGDVALALEQAGKIVHGLSPEKNHRSMFRNKHPESAFIHSKIEDFQPKNRYDLLLMSETNNYFSMNDGFDAIDRCVKPEGYALISGFFRTTKHPLINSNMVFVDDFMKECEKRNLDIIHHEHTSSKIIPSLRFAESIFRNYMLPVMILLQDLLKGFSPVIRFLFKYVFRKTDNFLISLEQWYDANLSEQFFRDNMEYHHFLIRTSK